ncbi:MAG TPA: hypothetical protein VK991_10795, partial [Halomonas sp.]|nr:hypothetical protein [Halomonas sp.]
EALAAEPGDAEWQNHLEALAEKTLRQQQEIEAADTQCFDDFLDEYFTRANETCSAVIMAAGDSR